MHIAFDISVLRIARAGVLTYTRRILDALITEGSEHTWTLLDVLPLNPNRPMRPLAAFDAPGVRVVRCTGLKRGYLSELTGLCTGPAHRFAEWIDHSTDPAWNLAAVVSMGVQLRSATTGVQIFHCSDQFQYAPPGAAVVQTVHDLTTRRFPEWHTAENRAMHAAKERFLTERAHRIIAVSEATRRDLIELLGIPAERISVVYEASDERFRPLPPAVVQPILADYGLTYGNYLLSLGTLEPRKNYVRLIEAYALLNAARNDLLPLVIAGARGWHDSDILAAPGRYGMEGRIRFLGAVSDADLPALIAGARIFVYPSLYEGFGLPALEALACGVPVIVSNSSSLPEVVGDAGLLCDPYDPESIAAQIRRLLEDEQLAEQLRQAGPRRAAAFSWQRAARETLEVYRQAWKEHR
jgi:alpha-1,3-rhamnosyl/mannosyltransferase